jgi:branched-chain amino acid transport system substrate-binding protein
MRSALLPPVLLLLLPSLLGFGLGCSSTKFPYSPCESNSQCREAFGRSWTCGDDQLCSESTALSRCSSQPPGLLGDLPSYEDRILIGSIFDQSDFEIMVKAARLAVLNVNTRNGLDATLFGIVECTNEANPSFDNLDENEATAAAGTYLSDILGIPIIVGPATSTRTEVAYSSDVGFGTLHITPSATSPSLTDLDGTSSTDEAPGLLWRTAPPDSLQGQVIAQEMMGLGVINVGIVAQIGAYPESLAEVFQQHFTGPGVDSQLELYTEVADLGPLITQFNDPSYDGVLVISPITSDMAAFLNGASASQFSYDEKKVIFLPDGAFDVQLIEESISAISLFPKIRGTVPATPSGLAYNNFVAAYRSQFNGEDPSDFGFSAHAYDASWLAIAGAAWSHYQEGAITGLGAARGLRKLSDSSGPSYDLSQTDWNSITASLEEGTAIDVIGASGPLNYDLETGEMTSPIDVWTVECSGTTASECNIVPQYCVDLSESPSADCCTDPVAGCDEPGGDDDDSAGR